MIEISRDERDKLLLIDPNMKIRSTRHKFYLTTTDAAMEALNSIRGVKASRQHKPQYYRHMDQTAQKRPQRHRERRI